ncbi:MAG: Tyrosine--tRNA ligase [Pseudomonadales bacterium]|nr:Tyrosine--tRNA ligase [Pseudomonadales bacterium]
MKDESGVLDEFEGRGLVVQTTGRPELDAHLGEAARTVYCGFDPTADSLHIGSLVPLLALRRFQLAGHRPIALVGGATGLVGDPSFKAAERSLNAADTVAAWASSMTRQVARFLDTSGSNGALVVSNLDWFRDFRLLDFLRDVGKHFSINAMVQKDSVRQRIEREGEGISFAEFTYMILQAYDFAELNRRYGCTLQIGGSDQWGNITGGIDLCRRQNQVRVHALTFPLVTKADGTKFGKTESGTIWLDARKTSPYAFYQFWLNSSDADVYRFLRFFTFLPLVQIREIEDADAGSEGKPSAQRVLAREVTELVHGGAGLDSALRITAALFAGSDSDLQESDFEQLKLDGLPSTRLAPVDLHKPLTTLFAESGAATSGKQVKDALTRAAVVINGRACSLDDNNRADACFAAERAAYGRFYLARLGKKNFHLFEVLR